MKKHIKIILIISLIFLLGIILCACDGATGEQGAQGENGKDGLTPIIGSNGNWWIGDTDTGVAATSSVGGNNVFFTAKCGENAQWTMFNDGRLVISGRGAVDDKKLWLTFDKLITEVTIGDGITSIPENAFQNCANMTSVTIGNGVTTTIKDKMFENCNSLANIVIGNGVTRIEENAFYNFTLLKTVGIGHGIKSIGEDAFYNCTGLTSVYYTGDIASWCGITFDGFYDNPLYYAHNLYINNDLVTDLVIPDTVTEIKDNAFYNATCLTSVTIPDSVTSIGAGAFSGCSGLTSIMIPDSVTSMGAGAFGGTSLASVYYTGDIASWCEISFLGSIPNFLGDYNLYINNELVTDLVIPDGVAEIKDYAFSGCISLTSVTIPDNVTSIGNYAFGDCTSLTSITIPDSITRIDEFAFSACYKLVEVYNRSSLNITKGSSDYGRVGYYAKAIYTAPYESKLSTDENGYILYTDRDDISLIGYVGNDTALTLPAGITEINQHALYRNMNITSVTIPDSVTSIGEYAFYGCYKLVEVYNKSSLNITRGSEDNGKVSYYAKAIYTEPYESKLSTDANGYILYTDGEDIILLGYTGNATVLTLPAGITEINQCAFYYNKNITSVTIPDSVMRIGEDAFYGCTSLTSVCYTGDIATWCGITFGDMYSNPLSYAHNLYINNELVTNLVIPDSVREIKAQAFFGASCLTSVIISDSVRNIGAGSFYQCTALKSIAFKGTIEQWNAISKGRQWDNFTGAYTIHCNDGDIAK